MAKQKRRNGHAFHPIMKKGGVHEKSKSAERSEDKRKTKALIKEWQSRSFFYAQHLRKAIDLDAKIYWLLYFEPKLSSKDSSLVTII